MATTKKEPAIPERELIRLMAESLRITLESLKTQYKMVLDANQRKSEAEAP